MIYIIALISIAAFVAVDQIIKLWAYNNLFHQGSMQFIHFGTTEVINLSYHENTGAAFSIFSGKQIFLIIITSLFIVAGLYLIIFRKIKRPLLLSGVSLIVAGGIGNLIDRIFRGYVIDYVEVRLFNFAVFNFADCCVIIGTILFLIAFIFFDNDKKVKRKNA